MTGKKSESERKPQTRQRAIGRARRCAKEANEMTWKAAWRERA